MLAGTSILLIRHGEKNGDPCSDGDGDSGLSAYGQERADAYVDYFGSFQLTTSDGTQSDPFAVAYIFAAKDSKSSIRPRLTVTPLAEAHPNVPFDCQVADADFAQLVETLKDSQFDGAGIVICWHHGEILDFANALLTPDGGPPPVLPTSATWPTTKPPCTVFGWLFQIVFDANGVPSASWVRCLNEHLMSDDTVDPPG